MAKQSCTVWYSYTFHIFLTPQLYWHFWKQFAVSKISHGAFIHGLFLAPIYVNISISKWQKKKENIFWSSSALLSCECDPFFCSHSQGEILSQLNKEQQQHQQQRYEHHLRAAAAAGHYALNPTAASAADQHKFGPPMNGGSNPLAAAYQREEAIINPAAVRTAFPRLHSRSGQLAGYPPYGGGGGSPRLPLDPKGVTPPKQQQLLSPLGKATISSIARYSRAIGGTKNVRTFFNVTFWFPVRI